MVLVVDDDEDLVGLVAKEAATRGMRAQVALIRPQGVCRGRSKGRSRWRREWDLNP